MPRLVTKTCTKLAAISNKYKVAKRKGGEARAWWFGPGAIANNADIFWVLLRLCVHLKKFILCSVLCSVLSSVLCSVSVGSSSLLHLHRKSHHICSQRDPCVFLFLFFDIFYTYNLPIPGSTLGNFGVHTSICRSAYVFVCFAFGLANPWNVGHVCLFMCVCARILQKSEHNFVHVSEIVCVRLYILCLQVQNAHIRSFVCLRICAVLNLSLYQCFFVNVPNSVRDRCCCKISVRAIPSVCPSGVMDFIIFASRVFLSFDGIAYSLEDLRIVFSSGDSSIWRRRAVLIAVESPLSNCATVRLTERKTDIYAPNVLRHQRNFTTAPTLATTWTDQCRLPRRSVPGKFSLKFVMFRSFAELPIQVKPQPDRLLP